MKVTDFTIVLQLRNIVGYKLVRLLQGITMPIGVEINQRGEGPFLEPAGLDRGMRLAENRAGSDHRIEIFYRLSGAFGQNNFQIGPESVSLFFIMLPVFRQDIVD